LGRILGQAEALLLDFDGPVCDLFAGLPPSVVVDQLCVVLADGGYGDPPPEIEKSSDPFDVLKYAATLGDTEARYVHAALSALECEATASARPTTGAHDLILAWTRSRRPLAIVSNNSVRAVAAYFDLYGLANSVAVISGRRSSSLELLKPNPHLLYEALAELSVMPENAAFVGDSATDILAARAASVVSIAYANKPDKATIFAAEHPAVLITEMAQLLIV
jgi:HAD superfamily hydrolase (TIGR01549 family)